MKAGLSTSLAMHAALIAFGLVTLSAPSAHDAGEVQAIPIDMVSMEELTQLQQGDKTAPKAEKPAPVKTDKPHTVPDAKTIGNNAVDLDDVPKPEASPRKIDTASAPPPPASKPEPKPVEAKPEPKPEPTPVEAKPEPKPEPPQPAKAAEAPPTEPTPAVEPRPTTDPVAETIAAAEATPAMEFPDQLPRPDSRPTPPKPETAKPEQPKKTETARAEDRKPTKPSKETTASTEQDLESILDQAKALVNKQKPAGGGAKRSEQTASLGNDRPSNAQKLSANEMDALRQQLAGCWSIPAGMEEGGGFRASVSFRLSREGNLERPPSVSSSSGNRQFDESAVRAIQKCELRGFNLPADKYETWAEVVVNFDPRDMF